MVNAGLEEGHLLARRTCCAACAGSRRGTAPPPPGGNVEIGDEPDETLGDDPDDHAITEAEIPTTAYVHALARAAAQRRDVWWRELEILLVAYSGMRWGEHVALRANRVDATRRRITIDRQVIETRSGLELALPKRRRKRVTMSPPPPPAASTSPPSSYAAWPRSPRRAHVPLPGRAWARRSDYGRNLFDPAADTVGWPRRADGHWAWKFHSLRHVFATWALTQPGLRIEDVSRLLGHSSVRVTQDIYIYIYIHVHGDLYQRFYQATQ